MLCSPDNLEGGDVLRHTQGQRNLMILWRWLWCTSSAQAWAAAARMKVARYGALHTKLLYLFASVAVNAITNP